MGALQPLLNLDRITRAYRIIHRLALVLLAVLGGTLLLSSAHAQTPQVSLVTLATDKTLLNLPNHFGVPNAAVVNQNDDYAFTGEGVGPSGGGAAGSALFLRLHGAATATRLLQFGDPVPGLAGSTAVQFFLGGLNFSAHLAFAVDYTVSPPDGRLHRAILIYNSGTNSYSTVTSSDTGAAGSGGQKFGPSLGFSVGNRSLDDNGDVLITTDFEPFSGTDTVPNQDTFYIAPAGGTPVRVVGLGDAVPGEPGAMFVSLNSTSQINALGQFLFSGQGNNGTTTVSGLFLGSASGGVGSVTKVVANGDAKPAGSSPTFSISPATQFALNNSGQVAFTDPGTPASLPPVEPEIWLSSSGTITRIFSGPLPNVAGNSTFVRLNGLSDLGDALVLFSPGSPTSIARVHSSGALDIVASTGQAAPGVSGATFASFSNLLIDNNDRAVFLAFFNIGGVGLYQQVGTSTPASVALQGQSSGLSGGGTISAAGVLKALDNGSIFFDSVIAGGTANYGQFLGTPTSLQALMSTADTLPAGARPRLYLPTSNSGNNNNNSLFIAFAANLAGGQTAIFVRDIFSGTTARVVSEGDVIPGFGGATFVERAGSTGVKPFYMNGNGQVVFPAILSTGGQAILLAGPSANSVTTAAATGETVSVTGNPFLTSLDFSNNTTALSPINDSGQVAFYGTLSTGVSGIFLYDGGTSIFEVSLTGETVPEGGATFTNLTSNCTPCSLGINQNGQVAFGALKSGGGSGLYIGSPFGPPTKVVASGDTRPGSVPAAAFGALDPVSGFNDNGQVVFEPVFGGGVYTGPGTSGIPTVTAVALDGTANPGTGSGTLATETPAYSIGNFASAFVTTNAAIDNAGSGNFVFQSRVTGGTANSGYFRVLDVSGSPGPLQAAVLQGQIVTGAGTLGTMFPSFLNNSFFSIGSNNNGADFIFTNSFTNATGTMVGQFFSPGSGSPAQKLMVPGDAIAGTGGGVYSFGSILSHGRNDNTPIFEVLTTGGTASQAIVLVATESGTVATTTALVSLLNPSGIGQTAVFTATVTSAQGPPPVGDIVAFFDNGVALQVGFTDSNGQATFTTSSLSAGSHSITAEYFPSGGNNGANNVFLTSTSNVVTQVVSNATSTLLFSTQNPSVPGQSVLFEAIVSPVAPGISAPTGTVAFLDGATQIGTGTLSGDIATFSTSSLSAGSHTITAQYSGDSVFTASTSTPVTQVVQAASVKPSATALASSVNPSVAGQSVTFSATVGGSGGTPTGTVTFLDGATQIGTGTLNAGIATFSTSSLAIGSHAITAQYAGDTNFAASTSNLVTQIVQAASLKPSATALASSLNPSVAGQSVTFSATVGGSGGTPTGTVTFLDGAAQIGTGTLNAGIATFSTSSLSAGAHSITAQYSGDTNFSPSTSNLVTQSITTNPTTTTLISSLNPSVSTQSVEFFAIVTSTRGGTPTGSVTFFDGTGQIGTGTLNASGVATFTTSSLVVGPHSITAQFVGGAIFVGSTSTALTQTVTINPTSTVLVSSLNPSFSTQFVQFTAIVSSATGATATGSVSFFDGTNQIGTGTLNASGQATFGLSSLSIGSHTITAQYLGTANFVGSTSAAVTQTVSVNVAPMTAPTFVAIASSPNPSAVGQSVSITATVSSSLTTATPTGHITFFDNGTPLTGGVIQLVSGSATAAFSTSSLTAGSHPLTAQYSGDANFALSLSAVLSQTVGTGTQQVSIQITPIPTNVAPRSTCPLGGYCQQFGATVQNGGNSPTVTWQVLSGPGSIDSTGNYTAGPSVTQGPVTISASVTGASASVSFTLGPDALTTSQPPATVAAGTPLMVAVQLSGVPASSIVPFTLSCGSLPASTTCQFSNNSATPAGCPMGTITFVTGTCPNFTVTLITTGVTSSTHLAPLPFELGRPWYGLFALMLSALALTGRRRSVVHGRMSYACCVLALLCISVVFLASCSVIPQASPLAPPSVVPATPSGSYQAVVLATPPNGPAGGGFVQTQLIVPLVVK